MHKKINVLKSGKSYNCYSGCICYILENFGTIFSEAVSFGLSGGLGFIFSMDEKMGFSCVREKHCLTEYLLGLGIRVAELPITDYVWLQNHIKKSVSCEEPVMLRYDGFYLPYTPIYQKRHDVRIGLVTGYEDGFFYMTDFVYEVINYRVSETNFLNAVFSKECDRKTFETFFVTVPMDIDERVTKEDIKGSIIECTNFFLNSVSTNEKLLGLDGMEKFIRNIKEYLENMYIQDNWDELLIDLKQATVAINNYSKFFLEIKSAGLLDMSKDIVEDISLAFKSASERWNLFCNGAVLYKLTKRNNSLEMIKRTLLEFYSQMNKAFSVLRVNI